MSTSSELVVIVDDRAATREGQWTDGGVSQEYLHTTSSSTSQGSNLTLEFQGKDDSSSEDVSQDRIACHIQESALKCMAQSAVVVQQL